MSPDFESPTTRYNNVDFIQPQNEDNYLNAMGYHSEDLAPSEFEENSYLRIANTLSRTEIEQIKKEKSLLLLVPTVV